MPDMAQDEARRRFAGARVARLESLDADRDPRACRSAAGRQATAPCSWASRVSDSISPSRTWAR
jgi:hypothetical protein